MVESGNVEWDVTEIGGQDAIRATQMGLVEKIDDKIVDRSKYPEKARTPYVFASSVYTTIIGYRTDVFKGGTPAQELGRLVGRQEVPRRALDAQPSDRQSRVRADRRRRADGQGLSDRLRPRLQEARPDQAARHVWWSTGQQPAQLLLDKEVVLATGWNGRFYDLIKKGAPIEIEWNQGALKQGSFVIPSGAKNPYWARRCWPRCRCRSSRRSMPPSSAIPASTSKR